MLVVGVGIDSAGWLLCYCVRVQNSVLYLLYLRYVLVILNVAGGGYDMLPHGYGITQ